MKILRSRTLHLGVKKIAIVALLFGVVMGTIFANLFKNIYLNSSTLTDSLNIDKINMLQINYGSLLKLVLVSNYKKFFLVWLLSLTVLGIPFIIMFILYHGFSIGFIISVVTMEYGIKGILLFFSYLFPQYIIYIPVYIITLWKAYQMCTDMYNTNRTVSRGRMNLLVKNFPMILILAVLLLLGVIVETYLNTFIMLKVSSLV